MLNTITVGDARELAKNIPDGSIDLVFCDPPYLKENIEDGIYEWLSEVSSRVLKPDGFCLAYVGSIYTYDAMLQMGKHLRYFWTYIATHRGGYPTVWSKNVYAGYKPILAFAKGQGKPRRKHFDLWQGCQQDKRFHKWGQGESTANYYIDCFSSPGDTIADFFCGGGTVPAVCKQLGRNFIAFEIDPLQTAIARKRLETTQLLLMPEEEIKQLRLA